MLKKLVCLVSVTGIAALGVATSAYAGTVTLNHACYVSRAIGQGTSITVNGAGFTPGEAVFAQIPAPDGLLSFTEATVGPEGSFSATLTDVMPVSIDPVAEKETMQIKGVLSSAILGEAPFELTNLAVKTNPPVARPNKKVKYSFSGFLAGKAIYAHYLHNGKVVATHKFGKASGACGLLKTKARMFPGHNRYSHYKVQFDNSKKYSTKSSPRIDTTVSVLRF